MAYRGLVWPLRLNSQGDFQSGTNREVIKSDIRTALQTRRYVDEDLGGERKMRPGAFGQLPFALIESFDQFAISVLVEEYIREALQVLVDEGKITLRQVFVEPSTRGVKARIGYVVTEENLRDNYEYEITTEKPVDVGKYSEGLMAALVGEPNVKYTDKDFTTIRAALVNDFLNRFGPVNTDFSSTNYVTAFIEVIAYVGDLLAFTQDAQARECFFPTAVLRESILKHARLIGYEVPGRVAATAQVRIELLVESLFPTTIPAGSILFTGDGEDAVRFQTLEDALLPAGPAGTFVEVWVENSLNFSETFFADGSLNQEFITSAFPVLLSGIDGNGVADPDVVTITVDTIPYEIVPNFLDSEPTSADVTVTLGNNGEAFIRFGDDINGIAPSGEVVVNGRTGGGTIGNNARITQGPAFRNSNGDPISISIINDILSGGGADEQSIEEAKIQAPLSLQASNRTVSRQDFITNAEGVPGIDRALPLTSNEDVSVPENTTELLLLTDSPTNAQIIGGNAAADSVTSGVDDDIAIGLNGEPLQVITLGTITSDGDAIAAAIQAAVRALTPAFPLDNDEAYSNFTCTFDSINFRYILTSGQASLSAQIEIGPGPNDATVALRIDLAQQVVNTIGAQPSAGAIAAVTQELTVNKPICITHILVVLGPGIEIISLDFEVRFDTTASTQALKAVVRDNIRAALQTFFQPRLDSGPANPEIDFGRTVRFSDLISVVNGVAGVESVDEDTFIPADDVPVGARDFPVLGGIVVRDKTTGLPV